jgi:hypothetical protein
VRQKKRVLGNSVFGVISVKKGEIIVMSGKKYSMNGLE